MPRTSAFASLTPWKSGAFCFRPGAPGSTMYHTWITGTPALAARGGEALHVLDDVLRGGVRRRAGVGEGAALDDHVVLQVLDHQGRRLRVDSVHSASLLSYM